MDVSTDAVVGLFHVLANKGEGVGHGQQREQLVLLRLVVEDLGLWLSVGKVYILASLHMYPGLKNSPGGL